MKKSISFILLCAFILILPMGICAENDIDYYDDYLLKCGFPEQELKNLTDSNKEFMVEYIKEQGGNYEFSDVDRKVKTVNSKPQSRYIDPSQLELSVYYYEESNYVPQWGKRYIAFPSFRWTRKNTWAGLKPHVIVNDSFSYCVDPNSMEILPGSSRLTIDYYVIDTNGHIEKKTLKRPTDSTWASDTYRIPKGPSVYANSGMASFTFRRLEDSPYADTILLHYVNDTSSDNKTVYTLTLEDIFKITVSSEDDSFEETSERLQMIYKNKK